MGTQLNADWACNPQEFPNLSRAFTALLTLPITTTTAERSFSALTLIVMTLTPSLSQMPWKDYYLNLRSFPVNKQNEWTKDTIGSCWSSLEVTFPRGYSRVMATGQWCECPELFSTSHLFEAFSDFCLDSGAKTCWRSPAARLDYERIPS